MQIAPSLKLIEYLEKLTQDWNDWGKYREYYISELLPSLQHDHSNTGSAEERRLMSQIQQIASPDEWENLGLIVAGLDKFRETSSELTKSINDLFRAGKFKEAELQYGQATGTIYPQVRQEYATHISNLIAIHINDKNSTLASAEFERHHELFSDEERVRLLNNIRDAKAKEEKEKHILFLKALRRSITNLLSSNHVQSAKNELSHNHSQLAPEEYAELKSLILEEEENAAERILNIIKRSLASFEYARAEELYNEIAPRLSRAEFENMMEKAKAEEVKLKHIQFIESQIELIAALLKEYKFEEAAKTHQAIKDEYRIEDYHKLEKQFRIELEKENFIKKLEVLFSQKNFNAADQAFLESTVLNETEYLRVKSKYLANALEPYGKDAQVNDEQAVALAHFNNRLLVKARAGSGKTRLLTAKTLLLVDFEAVHPDHILIMAFNRDAANTVKTRIKELAKTNQTKAFENARTFHSLAHQIVQPSGKLLFDNKGDFVRKEFSEFVQAIFREIATPDFSVRLYEFFRREMMSVQRSGALMNDKEYYLHIRNQRYSTLRGEKVKSIGEKFIADFLFEHNLGYAYEKDYIWNGRIYHPDFSLFINGDEFIIEHWGIDENDPDKSAPETWDRGWDGYHEEMQEKRAYWDERSEGNEKKNFILIETSVVDMKNGRAAFEDILKSRLVSQGIVCKKLPERELIQKVFRMQIDRMTNLLVQFILKAKKRRWNAAETRKQVSLFSNTNAKTRFFLELGCMVYEAYETKIQGKIDFDELVNQAVQRIHSSKANILIPIDGTSSRQLNLSNLEWLLIDEYQDFSPLFYDLVDAIQTYNPKLKIVCVGDDWQAINSFAGSDLSYFNEYQTFFPNAGVVPLTTNYRSKSAIVETGNQIMQGNGDAGKALRNNNGGNVYIDDIEEVKLPYRNGDKVENNPDIRYLFFDKSQDGSEKLRSNGFMVGRYLKACHKIISNEKHRSKSFVILTRNNQVYGIDLTDFLVKLKSILAQQLDDTKPSVKISTVHSFKGLEADCVILLQACQGYFPSIHPDNKLFEVFGQTEKSVLDEERRLFYVAVTRARENLFILTENSRRSDFLSSMRSNPFLGYQDIA